MALLTRGLHVKIIKQSLIIGRLKVRVWRFFSALLSAFREPSSSLRGYKYDCYSGSWVGRWRLTVAQFAIYILALSLVPVFKTKINPVLHPVWVSQVWNPSSSISPEEKTLFLCEIIGSVGCTRGRGAVGSSTVTALHLPASHLLVLSSTDPLRGSTGNMTCLPVLYPLAGPWSVPPFWQVSYHNCSFSVLFDLVD